jgi:hypothetical protein
MAATAAGSVASDDEIVSILFSSYAQENGSDLSPLSLVLLCFVQQLKQRAGQLDELMSATVLKPGEEKLAPWTVMDAFDAGREGDGMLLAATNWPFKGQQQDIGRRVRELLVKVRAKMQQSTVASMGKTHQLKFEGLVQGSAAGRALVYRVLDERNPQSVLRCAKLVQYSECANAEAQRSRVP